MSWKELRFLRIYLSCFVLSTLENDNKEHFRCNAITAGSTSLSIGRTTADGTEEPRTCSLPREFFQCHSQWSELPSLLSSSSDELRSWEATEVLAVVDGAVDLKVEEEGGQDEQWTGDVLRCAWTRRARWKDKKLKRTR